MSNNTTDQKVFEKFTNLYSLSKTLRFELKPIGNTQKMLDNADIFKKDKIRKEKYEQTKPFFDELHREFINECLKDKKIENLERYFKKLEKLQKNKKDDQTKKEFKDISKELREEINNYFKENPLFETIFSKEVFEELKKKYGEREDSFLKDESGNFILDDNNQKISIFDEWKNFTGYFDKFQETRKNLYKDDGTSTAVATRIIDQNLKRFCENLQLFNSIKDRINFKEVESNFSVNLDNVFLLNYYNSCMLQNGINKYNEILGGKTKENGEKLKGLNEVINKYRQDSKEKIDFFKLLDKQILSEKEDFFKSIEDDEDLLNYLKAFFISAEEKTGYLKKILDSFFNNPKQYDLEKVYLSKEALNTILYKWMSDEGRSDFQQIALEQNKKDKTVSFDKNSDTYKFPNFIPMSMIKNVLDANLTSNLWKDKYFIDEGNKNGCVVKDETKFSQFINIFKHEFNSLFENKIIETINGEDKEKRSGYDIFKPDFKKIIDKDSAAFSVSQEEKITIKNFVDSTLWIYQMGKYFALEKKRNWIGDEYKTDSDFYDHTNYGFKSKFYEDAYENIVKTRMLIQSYLTKKPFNTDKWKLNFENPTLADGFDKNKEANNTTVILRKDGKYYLAIMRKGFNKIFEPENIECGQDVEKNKIEKMVYKTISDPVKDIPNLMVINEKTVRKTGRKDKRTGVNHLLEELKNKYLPEDINRIRKDNSYLKTSDSFNKENSQKYLEYYMDRLIEYKTGEFEFNFKKPKEYNSYSEFLKDVSNQGYKISFEQILEDYVIEKNNDGELFLFQIYNKDFELDKSIAPENYKFTGRKTPNLHTAYFEELFSENNVQNNFTFKLNGQAELFFRPKTSSSELGEKLDKNNRKVINHKRYAKDKIFFHVPITLNRTAGEEKKFNQRTNEFLAENSDINIIGIDRGEKHLIYFAGIDQKGNLLKDKEGKSVIGSLNEIKEVNYHKLLEERAKNREKERQDWQNIEGIKDLKKGYISLVVRELTDLMVEHNAIIVLEDLNMRFKQIRGGIEKSVYQQLEKALIDKLNFLVNKGETDTQKAGNLLRAYQLTAPFTTFKDMGKQTGTMFYTQAGYTSKTCPVCGFRPNINWSKEDVIEKINISYQNDSFIISYRLSDFVNNKNKSKRNNILYQEKEVKDSFKLKAKDAIRYKWFSRNKTNSEMLNGMEIIPEETKSGITLKYDINKCLKNLFEKEGIDYTKDIKSEMNDKVTTKKFYKDLSFLLYLLSNTRSSISGKDIDIINCPYCGFNSDSNKKDSIFAGCEFNGDANGAYNIARKGIMILEKINQFKKDNGSLEKMSWGDLFIDIEEWDKFTQSPK